jgi:hypothetical protein
VTQRYRVAIPSVAVFVAIAAIALGWPLFADLEAHRAGYISRVLKRGAGCGAKISASAQDRLQHYMQANVVSFTEGFADGAKQVEKTREAAGYANTCRLLVSRYASARYRGAAWLPCFGKTTSQWWAGSSSARTRCGVG